MTLPYMKFATNNLAQVLQDSKGARCVYCLGHPVIDLQTEVCDTSTVICPDCGVDAVVPASAVSSEKVLYEWHKSGFKT